MKALKEYGLSGGDIGVIAVAIMFALGTLYLFIGPSPFAGFFTAHNEVQTTGEVTVGIEPKSPPKP